MTNRTNKVPLPDRYSNRKHDEITPTNRFITLVKYLESLGNVLLRDHERIRMEANGRKSQFTIYIFGVSSSTHNFHYGFPFGSSNIVATMYLQIAVLFQLFACVVFGLKIYRNLCLNLCFVCVDVHDHDFNHF